MTNINNRAAFIKLASSEKIVLASINAKTRLYVFSEQDPLYLYYTKSVPYFVEELKYDNTILTKVSNKNNVIQGSFFYEIQTSTLYFRLPLDADPVDHEIIVTYKFFYSTKSLTLSHNLQDVSEDVFWDGRIVSNPGYKHKIGIDQALSSLIGEGTLHLKNNDGGLSNIFDRLIFENQDVVIYSWNPNLPPSESKVIYRGRVTNKSYDGTDVKFKIKDQLFALLDAPQLEAYSDVDNVSDSVKGQFKRRVYGRVDGLRCQSTSQIADGITLTGTVSGVANSNILTGAGTLFLSEVLQDDEIQIGTQTFNVDQVLNDTSVQLTDEIEYGFSGQPAIVIPDRGTTLRNRTFLAAGHVCAEVQHTILLAQQFNRITLDSTEGLFPGDFIEFTDTLERIEIKNTAPGNVVVLQQNMVTKPAVGTFVIRRPIQEVYVKSRKVSSDDYSIFNTGNQCGIVLQNDVEFNLARPKNTKFTTVFTNGSRTITSTNVEVSLQDIFEPGDYIKPDGITYTTFYKVVNVRTTEIDISVPFADASITDIAEVRKPDYIEDDTEVSVNILGKTEDGTAGGVWIQTAAQILKDLIKDVGITQVNNQSFIDGNDDAYQLMSLAIPFSFSSKSVPTVKDIADKVNQSVRSSLTLDNDLLIKFKVLNVYTGEDLPVIRDEDVIEWKITSTNGKTYKTALGRYRFTDTDLSTLDDGNKFVTFDSEFVKRYIGTSKVDELDLYLYKTLDAEIAVHRHLYYNRLGTSTLSLTTDLRLEGLEIGDVIIADFKELYERFGDRDYRKKKMLVIGKTVTGERTQLELSDLGNTFNTSAYITPNDAPEYNLSTSDQKLIYGYITDNQGIVENVEDTAGINLIS